MRALGFAVTGATQLSCNLLDPTRVTPLDVYRRLEPLVEERAHVVRCELVGLLSERALRAVPEQWWERLDLAEDRTVEARAARAGVALS